jgi:hypothetical protein
MSAYTPDDWVVVHVQDAKIAKLQHNLHVSITI